MNNNILLSYNFFGEKVIFGEYTLVTLECDYITASFFVDGYTTITVHGLFEFTE